VSPILKVAIPVSFFIATFAGMTALDKALWQPGGHYNRHEWMSESVVPPVTDDDRAAYQACLKDAAAERAKEKENPDGWITHTSGDYIDFCQDPDQAHDSFTPIVWTYNNYLRKTTRTIALDYCLKHGEWRVLYDRTSALTKY